MTTSHTPGPWSALPEECDKPYVRIRGTHLGERYKIANVITPVYDGVLSREAVETRANARLIAAAPDLLAALKQCLSLMPSAHYHLVEPETAGRTLHIAENAARAAILKATS